MTNYNLWRYVIGSYHDVLILGHYYGELGTSTFGFIPICRAKLISGTAQSVGWVTYDLKPRFSFDSRCIYNVKIVQYVQ